MKNHIDALGIKSISAYQKWCTENGFSRRLNKTPFDRRRERLAIARRKPACDTRPLKRVQRSHQQTVDQIFEGRIRCVDVSDKRHQTLCDAVERLRLLESWQQSTVISTFRLLYLTCQSKRARFIENVDPALPAASFQSCTFLQALASVATFADRWIRPLENWKFRTHNPRRQFESLMTHLFAAHKTPKFLYSVWFQRDFLPGLAEQQIFAHVAAGHSIRQARLPIPYSRKMSFHFLKAPDDCHLSQAIRWGQIMGMGGDPTLAGALIATFLGNDFSNQKFWTTVVQWFIDQPMFDRHRVGPVIDYLNNQKYGTGNQPFIAVAADGQRAMVDQPAQPNLSMRGRTPISLLRDVDRWHHQLQFVGSRYGLVRWRHSGIREFRLAEGAKSKSVWTIGQLLSSQEMIQEGRLMKHCVASYTNSCYRGRTSIWSMQHHQDGQSRRLLTVEVDLCGKSICQARGKNNRLPNQAERDILRRWALVANLQIASYL